LLVGAPVLIPPPPLIQEPANTIKTVREIEQELRLVAARRLQKKCVETQSQGFLVKMQGRLKMVVA
jgi:hypothetical protein